MFAYLEGIKWPGVDVNSTETMTMQGKMKFLMNSSPLSEASTSHPTGASAAAPGSPPRQEPFTHPHTLKKLQIWALEVRKKTLILGDSNFSRIPTDPNPRQFPRCKIPSHNSHPEKTPPPCHNTTQVIISIGLNNGLSEHTPTTSIKQLQAMWKERRV